MDMATIERLVQTKSLITSRLMAAIERDQPLYLHYDGECDELLLQFVPPDIMTVVHYIDEHVAFLYEPDSMEIVGFQVEAFQTSFLPKHESLKRVWRLSDSGAELDDIEDLVIVFEKKKREVAREMMHYTEPWLQELFSPDSGAHRNPVAV